MQNIWTIAKREYNNYFSSPLAYVIAAGLLFLLGAFFYALIADAMRNAIFGGGSPPDIAIINGLFAFLMLLIIPALTMRLISDELRAGTLELLLTAPVQDYELVVGKWLGSLLFMLSVIAVTFVFPIIVNSLAEPGIDQVKMLSSYLGLILVAASLLALGTGISAMFSNQIAAFFVTLMVFLMFWWLLGLPASFISDQKLGEFFRYLVIGTHFDDTFNRGVFYLSDVVYFLSLIAIGLFTGTVAVQTRRWR